LEKIKNKKYERQKRQKKAKEGKSSYKITEEQN